MPRRLAGLLTVLALLCWGVGAALAQAAKEPDFGRYHALIIGNNDYRLLPKLATAVNDATVAADLLASRYGFRIELLLNATRDDVVKALNRLRADLTEEDNLLIYYAGHGVLDKDTDRGFWLPVDAEAGNESRWIDVSTISSNLRAMSAKHVLVIADSCYSGTLLRNAPATLPTGQDRQDWLFRVTAARARLALVSGGLEPVADGGGSGHSVFARALFNALRSNAQVMSGQQLFEALREPMLRNAQQTPAYSDIRFAGHDGGEFLFVPLSRAPVAGGPAAAAPDAGAFELAFWDSVRTSNSPADYQAYLEAYPNGRFAALARLRVANLAGAPTAEAAPTPRPRPAGAAPAVAPSPAPAAPPIQAPGPSPAPPPAASARPAAPAETAAPQAGSGQQTAMAAAPAAGGSIADAAEFARRWDQIRRRVTDDYNRNWRFNDMADSMSEIFKHEVVAVDPEKIRLIVFYGYVTQGPFGRANRTGRALFELQNRAPDFTILDMRRQ